MITHKGRKRALISTILGRLAYTLPALNTELNTKHIRGRELCQDKQLNY